MIPSRPIELLRALAVLGEPPTAAHARLADAVGLHGAPTPPEYTEAFVLGLSPYASVHLGPEGMIGGEARDRIAGFWRAVGQTPPAEPDHLGALLGLYAWLAERGEGVGNDGAPDPSVPPEATSADAAHAVLVARARDALLHEHIAPWLPMFLERVESLGGFYAGWAALLARTVEGELVAAPPPARLPLHLRDAPPLADPREEGASAFLAALLAPVRSGMIVTRFDLVRIARGLDLGARIGERRWVLEHLLGLEPECVLAALSKHARAAAAAHARRRAVAGDMALWWQARAAATAALLDELADLEAPAASGAAPTP